MEYAAASRTGLFEGAEDHYGEVWYELGNEKAMIQSTTEPIVLEELYQLAHIRPPEPMDEPTYTGYPLAVRPEHAAWIFYGLLPAGVCLSWFLIRYRRR